MLEEEKRFDELARRAAYGREAVFTRFIEASSLDACRHAANVNGVKAFFHGGYPDAERVVCGFSDSAIDEAEYPVACVEITWNAKFAKCAHRDILGAVMALGLERDSTGDIIVAGNGKAYLFAHEDIAPYIASALTSAGRTTLKNRVYKGEITVPEPEGSYRRITAASERLDAVIQETYDMSRSEAQRLITSGMVKYDHAEQTHTDFKVKEGAVISVRTRGRFRITSSGGVTRRGRLAFTVFIYGSK